MSVDTTSVPAQAVPMPRVVRRPTAGSVVVGLDGSPGSRAALDLACDEAALRALPVAAVVVWPSPDLWVTPYPLMPSAHDMQSSALDLGRGEIDSALNSRAARGASTPRMELVALSGPPATVLERLSFDAAMLVVGHRGLGAIASRFIGSVGLGLVVHAHCSVVVVRADGVGGRDDEHGGHAT